MPIKTIIAILFLIALPISGIAQTKSNIIFRLNNNKKADIILANRDIMPAINIPNITKANNKLMSNSKSDAFLQELKSYYYVQVEADKVATTMHDLQSQNDITTVFKSVIYQLNQDNTKTNDPLYSSQWALPAIEIANAWMLATGKNILVGIVDTGIDYDHEDLQNQIWINSGEDANANGKFDNWSSKVAVAEVYGDLDGMDNDGNGYVDDVIGYDFIDKKILINGDVRIPDPNPYDEHGHGTYVAGVIAANHNNNIGITGIAYNAKIIPLRAFDVNGNGECKDVANSIVYAVLNGAKVINMSFGEYESSPIMHTAIKFAEAMGCILVASSGNQGVTRPHYPSDYSEVISVAGCDDALKNIYNYGDRIAISAPAKDIITSKPNNQYGAVNGTSFSAPMVAAVSAMLLEKDSSLTTQDVKGIIQTTATQVNKDWTIQYGAGILNAYKALQYVGKTKLEIESPRNDAVINLSTQDSLVVIGSTLTPLFESYLIRIQEKDSNTDKQPAWDTLTTLQYKQISDDTLSNIYIKKYSDKMKIYSLSLLVNLKNGNTYETRNHIKFCSDTNGIEINNLAIYTPFYYEDRVVMFNIKTNVVSTATIYYRRKGSDDDYKAIVTSEYDSDNHALVAYNIPANIEFEGYVLAILEGADTARKDFEFTKKSDHFDYYTFTKKNYTLPPTYLYKRLVNLYGENRTQFIANELSVNMDIGNIKIWEYDDKSEFNLIDSTDFPQIIAGTGDSNNDGIVDILGFLAGTGGTESKVFERKDEQSSNFSSIIFDSYKYSTKNSPSLLAEAMQDVDNDGIDELILIESYRKFFKLNDGTETYIDFQKYITIYSFKDNNYQPIAHIDVLDMMPQIDPNFDTLKIYNIQKGIAIGDFDGNGKLDFAVRVVQGQAKIFNEYMLIIELDNMHGQLKNYLPIDNYFNLSPVSHYITTCNLNNDGKDDIAFLNYGKISKSESANGENEVWTYSVFMYNDKNEFEKVFEDDILGVRQTVGGFRNGINSGDLDGISGDEITITTFPNLYVLKWSETAKTLKPFWNYAANMSNTTVIGDIDGDGKAELGFCTFNATEFFILNPKYIVGTEITDLDGWATSNEAAHFEWNAENSDVDYELLLIKTENLVDTAARFTTYKTQHNYVEINNLTPNTSYTAFIKPTGENDYYSEPITIYTINSIKPISANLLHNDLLNIKFNGKLPYQIEGGTFTFIAENDKKIIPIAEISNTTDSLAVIDMRNKLTNGNYILIINSFRDYYGNYTIADTLNFNIESQITPYLYLTDIKFEYPNQIILGFSEPTQGKEASNINNYSFYPYGQVEQITQFEANKIKLLLSQNIVDGRGKNYLISASANIISDYGNHMINGSGNTLGFVVAESDVKSLYVYPSPIKLSKNENAFIGHLSERATVEIYTIDGKLLRELEEYDGNGGVEWDLRDSQGELLEVGVYLIKAINLSDSSEKLMKFAITK